MTHLMLDIETLGTRPGCVVMSVALVAFADEAKQVQINLGVAEQQARGLETDAQTQTWWTQQDPAAWYAATCNPLPVAGALDFLTQWIQWAANGADALVWCHGATFDAPILGELYRRFERSPPWQFWNVRDTRTLYDLAGVNVKDFAVPPPHVALNDAIAQTRAANTALKIIAGNRGLV